jgi:hypothetical protein
MRRLALDRTNRGTAVGHAVQQCTLQVDSRKAGCALRSSFATEFLDPDVQLLADH